MRTALHLTRFAATRGARSSRDVDARPELDSLGEELRTAPVLVALSASDDASGAIAVAEAIQQRYGGAVHSVYVFGHPRLALPARVPSAWAIHLDTGRAVNGILRCADRTGAALIVVGLRRHGVIDHLLHEETAVAVVRQAPVPVLASVPGLRGLPRRAVAAIDFGPASLRAAQAVVSLLGRPLSHEPALLRLAFVKEPRGRAGAPATVHESVVTRLGIEAAFDALKRELDPPPHVRVESTVLEGAPASSLLAFAADSAADLLAVGSVGQDHANTGTLGDVTRTVIRAACCSVLAMPSAR